MAASCPNAQAVYVHQNINLVLNHATASSACSCSMAVSCPNAQAVNVHQHRNLIINHATASSASSCATMDCSPSCRNAQGVNVHQRHRNLMSMQSHPTACEHEPRMTRPRAAPACAQQFRHACFLKANSTQDSLTPNACCCGWRRYVSASSCTCAAMSACMCVKSESGLTHSIVAR